MKTRVLLIFVGQFNAKNPYHHYVSPLGIANISAYLNINNISCKQVDMRLLPNFESLKKILLKYKPKYIGYSLLTTEADLINDLVSKIKTILPKSKMIVGGPHPSVLPQESASIPGIDVAVIGEGELTIVNLIKTLDQKKPLTLVNGIAFRNHDNKIVVNPPREFIKNLDALPFPDRHILGSGNFFDLAYDLFFPMKYPYANLFVSRGCPAMCTMCQPTIDKLFGRPFRFRSAPNVISEIKILIKKYNVKSIIFWDDTLTANRQWMKDFTSLIIKEKLVFDWWCYSRVNYINPEVLKIVKESGCKMICFGIESGSDRILKVINKGTNAFQNALAINLCHQFGILANANLMIGMPTETLSDVKLTDQLISRTQPDIVWASVLSPLPGTYLGDAFIRSDEFQRTSAHNNWSELIRAQTGKAKINNTIDIKYIIKYQSRWHSTRFNPKLIFKKYYLQACINRILCHITFKKYDRIIDEFIFGPIIELSRHLYWIMYFFWHYVLFPQSQQLHVDALGQKRSKVLG
jgi:magnesium-protoporphyrin IX monomethyl ester (oxidative) cyclase